MLWSKGDGIDYIACREFPFGIPDNSKGRIAVCIDKGSCGYIDFVYCTSGKRDTTQIDRNDRGASSCHGASPYGETASGDRSTIVLSECDGTSAIIDDFVKVNIQLSQ